MRQDPVHKKGRAFLIPLGFKRKKGLVTCSGKMVCAPAYMHVCVCAGERERERDGFSVVLFTVAKYWYQW